jgi:hypothetical protein
LSASLVEQFGSGSYSRGADCRLPAHYSELQALCDALGHAAQAEMAEALQRSDPLARERAYGKWLGLRGILRAIEARTDEWTATEVEMLERIDWTLERFVFPGSEAFDIAHSEPGQPQSH